MAKKDHVPMKEVPVFEEGGKGRKPCKHCGIFVPARYLGECPNCGKEFVKKDTIKVTIRPTMRRDEDEDDEFCKALSGEPSKQLVSNAQAAATHIYDGARLLAEIHNIATKAGTDFETVVKVLAAMQR